MPPSLLSRHLSASPPSRCTVPAYLFGSSLSKCLSLPKALCLPTFCHSLTVKNPPPPPPPDSQEPSAASSSSPPPLPSWPFSCLSLPLQLPISPNLFLFPNLCLPPSSGCGPLKGAPGTGRSVQFRTFPSRPLEASGAFRRRHPLPARPSFVDVLTEGRNGEGKREAEIPHLAAWGPFPLRRRTSSRI